MRNIINLIAKSFIFNNKSETCETDIAIAKNTNNNLEAAMRLERKQVGIRKCTILSNLFEFYCKRKLCL